jgi:hypothetical protein
MVKLEGEYWSRHIKATKTSSGHKASTYIGRSTMDGKVNGRVKTGLHVPRYENHTYRGTGSHLPDRTYQIALTGSHVPDRMYRIALTGSHVPDRMYRIALTGSHVPDRMYRIARTGSPVPDRLTRLHVPRTEITRTAEVIRMVNGRNQKSTTFGKTWERAGIWSGPLSP